MADFTALKTAIQQYIAQNGNKEITGNLLQTILLAMVQSMGDQAINGVLQMLSNEMIARENQDGFLGQALTAEKQRAIAAETKSAELNGEAKVLKFKNAAGQELYQVSVASLVSNGLVDVEVDGTNLVMTFHTDSGNEEITIPIGDIFNPSNYYTKTQIDGLLSPITTAITNVSSRLNAGYIYLGFADPETIPTSTTGKFFYIASQAGTYHFMSNDDIPIVISSDGLYILSGGVEADDWYLETIVTFTNNVQFNSSRLITSGGVFNAINPINELLHRNYILAGVADTTTIPTDDTNVFYLAGQGGTYTHFLDGGEEPLVLPKGLTVIYRGNEDDGWNYWVVFADNDFINTNRAQALTSNQQTEAQNNLEGKLYEPAQFSGLGKKMLAKNIQQVSGVDKNVMSQAFFQDEQGNPLTNTVFVIQYDYTLGGNITIPAGCTLQFDGGSIGGSYELTGQNTNVIAKGNAVFSNDVTIKGTWLCQDISTDWFSGFSNDYFVARNLCALCSTVGSTIISINRNMSWMPTKNNDALFILPSNVTLDMQGNSISTQKNNYTGYSLLLISMSENVVIKNGILEGDIELFDGESVEGNYQYGQGLRTLGCNNLSISDVTVKNMRGDGFVIGEQEVTQYGDFSKASQNVSLHNVTFDYNGRNGLSIVGSTNNIEIGNCRFTNTGQKNTTTSNPGSGVQIEPSHHESVSIYGLRIYDCQFKNNIHSNLCILDSLDSKDWMFDNIVVEDNDVSSIYIAGAFEGFTINNSFLPTFLFTVHSATNPNNLGNIIDVNSCAISSVLNTGSYNNKLYDVRFNNCKFDDSVYVQSAVPFQITQGHDVRFSNCDINYKRLNNINLTSINSVSKTTFEKCNIKSNYKLGLIEPGKKYINCNIDIQGFLEFTFEADGSVEISGCNIYVPDNLTKIFDFYVGNQTTAANMTLKNNIIKGYTNYKLYTSSGKKTALTINVFNTVFEDYTGDNFGNSLTSLSENAYVIPMRVPSIKHSDIANLANIGKKVGNVLFDETDGKPIFYNGSGWVYADGTPVS